jgi:hypothetical protein
VQTIIRERELASGARNPTVKIISAKTIAEILDKNMEKLEEAGVEGLTEIMKFIDQYLKVASKAA